MSDNNNDAVASVLVFLGAAVAFVAALIFVIPLTTLFGAIAGYIVALFFDSPLTVAHKLGLPADVTLWQLGAFLGFVGGFLRTRITVAEPKKDQG